MARSSASAQDDERKYREISGLPPAPYLKVDAAATQAMTDEQRNRWDGLEKAVRALERARLQTIGMPQADRATRLAALDASLVRYEAEKRHLRRANGG